MRSSWTRIGGFTAGIAIAAAVAISTLAPAAWAPPGAPAGVTPFSGDGTVSLAWSPTPGASSYTIYRGTSEASVTTSIGTSSTPAYEDTTAANGTAYFYKVVANSGAGDSPTSLPVSATPHAASCSTGNRIRVENCFPGSTGWKVTETSDADHDGIEGFTTATSVAAGGAVDLKINTAADVAYHVDVYRTGWYGGDQGRLVARLNGLSGQAQPSCTNDFSTGERSCAGWTTSATLQTSS